MRTPPSLLVVGRTRGHPRIAVGHGLHRRDGARQIGHRCHDPIAARDRTSTTAAGRRRPHHGASAAPTRQANARITLEDSQHLTFESTADGKALNPHDPRATPPPSCPNGHRSCVDASGRVAAEHVRPAAPPPSSPRSLRCCLSRRAAASQTIVPPPTTGPPPRPCAPCLPSPRSTARTCPRTKRMARTTPPLPPSPSPSTRRPMPAALRSTGDDAFALVNDHRYPDGPPHVTISSGPFTGEVPVDTSTSCNCVPESENIDLSLLPRLLTLPDVSAGSLGEIGGTTQIELDDGTDVHAWAQEAADTAAETAEDSGVVQSRGCAHGRWRPTLSAGPRCRRSVRGGAHTPSGRSRHRYRGRQS